MHLNLGGNADNLVTQILFGKNGKNVSILPVAGIKDDMTANEALTKTKN